VSSVSQDWVPNAAGLDAEKIKDVEEDEFGAKVRSFEALKFSRAVEDIAPVLPVPFYGL
jgi:hypothetical protein